MKKTIAVFLMLTLFLSGCTARFYGSEATDPTVNEADNTISTEGTELPGIDQTDSSNQQVHAALPMITVSVPVIIEDTTADDGTVIFRTVKQNMQLVMPDPDVAEKIIVDFLNRIDQVSTSNADTLEQAKSAYVPSDTWVPYLCSISYAPVRIDQSVLSFYGNFVQYNGGAHAVLAPRAANYNVITGDVLTLGSIITDESAVDKLCELTIEKLSAIAEEKYLRDEFDQTVKNRFAVEESYDEDWYFTTTGLCFYFDQYAIAPYSSGVITAEIPYNELIGIIDDAFFPPEIEEVNGTIMSSPADSTDMTQFTRISEIVVDTEAPMYVIYCDHTIQNLRISLNDADLGIYTIFAAQSLCASDAIVIQAEPGLFHQIDISYDSSNQTVAIPLLAE